MQGTLKIIKMAKLIALFISELNWHQLRNQKSNIKLFYPAEKT